MLEENKFARKVCHDVCGVDPDSVKLTDKEVEDALKEGLKEYCGTKKDLKEHRENFDDKLLYQEKPSEDAEYNINEMTYHIISEYNKQNGNISDEFKNKMISKYGLFEFYIRGKHENGTKIDIKVGEMEYCIREKPSVGCYYESLNYVDYEISYHKEKKYNLDAIFSWFKDLYGFDVSEHIYWSNPFQKVFYNWEGDWITFTYRVHLKHPDEFYWDEYQRYLRKKDRLLKEYGLK